MVLYEFFKDKKILLFAPKFFGYEVEVANKLRELGAQVDYFDERPGNDFWTKALLRVNKMILTKKTDAHYKSIIENVPKDFYDHVVFLNLEAISVQNLKYLKAGQHKAKFIMYMWDSLKNKKHTLGLLPYFDIKHTFDKMDSKRADFNFRPLFFLDVYKKTEADPANQEIDLLFVGTVHSDRYKLLMKIKEECCKMGKKVDFFMFFQSEKLFYARKLSDPSFWSSKKTEFSFKPLKKEEIIRKIENARVVLDIQHPGQKGLTMRTIEMIGAKKKIITTNKEIMGYDFYRPNNIHYIDRGDIKLEKMFFETDYCELDSEIYEKYAIEGWLKDIFSISKKDQT